MLLTACVGCSLYSKGAIYDIARAAVRKDPNFPPNAKIGSAKEGDFYIGKSAACVYVPYRFTDSAGAAQSGTYTVWLDRICIRWELNRCFPTPTYPETPPGKGS
jgi:hypothetical protein